LIIDIIQLLNILWILQITKVVIQINHTSLMMKNKKREAESPASL